MNTQARLERTPRVSLISGVVHAGDALSETLLADLAALDLLSTGDRQDVEAKVYCLDADVADTRIQIAADWRSVLHDPHFQASDLVIFHFGVYNDIHHLMNFVRRDARVIVWFHNITPPQYLTPEREDLVHRSFQQIDNFRVADTIIVNSRHTAAVLQPMKLGVPIEVARLFGRNAVDGTEASPRPLAPGATLELLCCGRFVESKSIHTVLEALALLSRRVQRPVHLALAGLRAHSNPAYIGQLQALVAALPAPMTCSFLFDLPSDELRRRMRESHALVMPSLHEGFGMPVIEAYAAGTPVLSTRNGALEEVCNGLALHFQAADAMELAERIAQLADTLQVGKVACEQGDTELGLWQQDAMRYAALHARDAYVQSQRDRLREWLQPAHVSPKSREEALLRLHREGQAYAASPKLADPLDAAVRGAIFSGAVASSFKSNIEQGLRALLRWPFADLEQSDADIAYWTAELRAHGVTSLVTRLGAAAETRAAPARLQMKAFVASLIAAEHGLRASVEPAGAQPPGDELAARLRLLAGARMPPADFIREAYRLVLRREPEEGGLGAYFEALHSGAMTREAVLGEMTASEEYRLLQLQTAGGARPMGQH